MNNRIFDNAHLPNRLVSAGLSCAPDRSMRYAMKCSEEQINQPFVGSTAYGNEASNCRLIDHVPEPDMITIETELSMSEVKIDQNQRVRRCNAWSSPKNNYTSGALWNHGQQARLAAVVCYGANVEIVCYADV